MTTIVFLLLLASGQEHSITVEVGRLYVEETSRISHSKRETCATKAARAYKVLSSDGSVPEGATLKRYTCYIGA